VKEYNTINDALSAGYVRAGRPRIIYDGWPSRVRCVPANCGLGAQGDWVAIKEFFLDGEWRQVRELARSETLWISQAKNRMGRLGAVISVFRESELRGES